MASSAGATFRWAGVGGGQHQSCDRPQLLPRGLSRALGPGFSRRGEKGHCTRLLFTVKGRCPRRPSGPRPRGSPSPRAQRTAPREPGRPSPHPHAADGHARCARAGGPGDRLACTWLCLWRPLPAWDKRTASVQFSEQTEVSTTNIRQPSALRDGDTVRRADRVLCCMCSGHRHSPTPAAGLPSAIGGARGARGARGPAGSKATCVHLNVLGKNADGGGAWGR